MRSVDIAVVLPSKNEEETIGICISKIMDVFKELRLRGVVIVADNSDDETPLIAREMGADVITPDRLGYGYAYRYAFKYLKEKYGGYPKYVVIGDADNTYDFSEMPKLLKPLMSGEADVVIGSRLRGWMEVGAMPWLHRYVGNPLLTWFLNLFFKAGISDAHSGFRAITGEALEKLELRSDGMEFASEMLVEAVRKGLRVGEVPISYYRRRGSRSKLSSLSDGWRHLKFMLINTPKHLYIYPGISFITLGTILITAAALRIHLGFSPGIHTSIAGSLLIISGLQLIFFGLFTSILLGERNMQSPTIEKTTAIGIIIFTIGLLWALQIGWEWVNSGFKNLPPIIYSISCLTLIAVGLQIFFASFILKLIAEQRRT